MLKGIAELKNPIQEFMTLKNKPILEFDDPQFMSNFAFLTDISSHLATLNLKLQRRGQLVNALFSPVRAFQAKLKLRTAAWQERSEPFPNNSSHELQRVRTEFCKVHF